MTHCHCRESPRAESQSGTEHQSDSVTSMYQNFGVMLPPGPEDQLLRRLEDVRMIEEAQLMRDDALWRRWRGPKE